MFRFSTSVNRQKPRRTRRGALGLGMENMEDRCLMAVGAILFNNSTGVVTIDGADTYADIANVTIDTRNTLAITDDLVHVELRNTGTPLIRDFNLASYRQNPLVIAFAPDLSIFNYPGVTEVRFHGYGGNDTVDNKSSVRLRAYGGAGHDTILGGSAADIFLGGAGNDYLDGRLGDDMMWGEAGADAM
ncbi:MAG TPA: hypothetical protein VIY86_06350, partial [Pirellulaceae bacterium]